MNKSVIWSILLGCLFLMGFASCSNDDEPEFKLPDPSSKGVFILNEGSWGNNNASLSYYDIKADTLYRDLFNGTLGDVAQDMLMYGNKLYIAVSGSNYISVINVSTKTEIGKIHIKPEGIAASPRYLASQGRKIYASVYSGYVVQIDTLSLEVTNSLQVGNNPEGIAIVNDQLFVAVTNASDYSNIDNKVAVVNLSTFSKTKDIIVNKNPYYLQANTDGYVYVSSQDVWNSDYSGIENNGRLQRINTKDNNQVEDLLSNMVLKYFIEGDLCYYFDYAKAGILNTKTKEQQDFITDGTAIGSPYGMAIDPKTKDIYLAGADYQNPGKVFVFNSDGKKKSEFSVGMNPNNFAFYY